MSNEPLPAQGPVDVTVGLLTEAADELAWLHREYLSRSPLSEGVPRITRLLQKIEAHTGHVTASPYLHRADCGYRGDWRETNRIISLHPKIKKVFDKSHKPSAEELIEVVRGYRNMATELIFELEAVKPARPTTGVQENAVQVSFIWDESFEEGE